MYVRSRSYGESDLDLVFLFVVNLNNSFHSTLTLLSRCSTKGIQFSLFAIMQETIMANATGDVAKGACLLQKIVVQTFLMPLHSLMFDKRMRNHLKSPRLGSPVTLNNLSSRNRKDKRLYCISYIYSVAAYPPSCRKCA